MSTQADVKRWIIGGALCGVLAVVAYALAVGIPSMPNQLGFTLAFSFGPLLAVCALGLYHFIRLHRNTLTLQAATVFMMLAGALITSMICMQQSVFAAFDRLESLKADPATAIAYKTGLTAGNSVQLGADVAWDMFIFPSTVLFGIAMWSHPKLGKIIGSIGILLGLAGTLLNIWTFPTPPAEAELFDVGPFTALWFLAVSIMILVRIRYADRATVSESAIGAASRVNA